MDIDLRYKGFSSTPKYCADNDMFYGMLDGVEDVVIYDASSLKNLKEAFAEAVDDYLDAQGDVLV